MISVNRLSKIIDTIKLNVCLHKINTEKYKHFKLYIQTHSVEKRKESDEKKVIFFALNLL